MKANDLEKEKNNFQARIIGLLGEEITKCWLKNAECPYENVGRPTIYWTENQGDIKHKDTLDFLFKKKGDDNSSFYLVEQKNFFAHYNGNLRTIDDVPEFFISYYNWSKQKCKSTPAWRIFNELDKHLYKIKVKSIREGIRACWGI